MAARSDEVQTDVASRVRDVDWPVNTRFLIQIKFELRIDVLLDGFPTFIIVYL